MIDRKHSGIKYSSNSLYLYGGGGGGGGAVPSRIVHSSPDLAVRGSTPRPGDRCVVFLGETVYSHDASLHPGL